MTSRNTGTLSAGDTKRPLAVHHDETKVNPQPTFLPTDYHTHGYTSAAHKKRSGEPKALHGPEQEPKPKPIKDPWGYKTPLTARALAMNNEHCCVKDDKEQDHNKLKEAFEGFGVDLSEPVLARMLQGFEGLTPMEQFLRQDK